MNHTTANKNYNNSDNNSDDGNKSNNNQNKYIINTLDDKNDNDLFFPDSLIPGMQDYVSSNNSKETSSDLFEELLSCKDTSPINGASKPSSSIPFSSFKHKKNRTSKDRTNRSKHLVSPYRVRRVKTGVTDDELSYIYRVYSKHRPKVRMTLPLWVDESVHQNHTKKKKTAETGELDAENWPEILSNLFEFSEQLSGLSTQDRDYIFQLFKKCAGTICFSHSNTSSTIKDSITTCECDIFSLFSWLV